MTPYGDCPSCADDDPLYSLGFVPDLEISLDGDALTRLRDAPREWTCGELRHAGEVFPIAVRLKGGASFRTIDGKAAFKIRFDGPCGSERRFFGRSTLTLNNMIQDRSSVREVLGYGVFRAAGVPAPRAGFARVTVNGELYGLYADVETVDGDFLARRFADPYGPLYEGGLDIDLVADDVWAFELDEGEDAGRAALSALVEAAALPGDQIFYGSADTDPPPAVEPLIDVDAFVTFLAVTSVTGDWDGYWKPNNYRVYFEPSRGRWTFLPWGLDQAWLFDRTAFDGDGVLIQKCMSSRRCLAAYLAELERVLALPEVAELPHRLDEVVALIGDAIAEDSRRPHGIEQVDLAQQALPVRFATLSARLHDQLGCLGELAPGDGAPLDVDGDGAIACRDDCDDSDPLRVPGAFEACDGVDDDCDGVVDDSAACPCQELDVPGARFVLCAAQLTWPAARQACLDMGGDLASIDDPAQNFALWAAAKPSFAHQWLLGLNDQVMEDDFRWTDGSRPTFFPWYGKEPNNRGGNEDCGELSGQRDATWNDIDCDTPRAFLCRLGPTPSGWSSRQIPTDDLPGGGQP